MQLIPLEQTVAGQELIQIGEMRGMQKGRQEGRREGLREGELMGKIRFAQRLLKYPVTSRKKLLTKSFPELRRLFKQLEAGLV